MQTPKDQYSSYMMLIKIITMEKVAQLQQTKGTEMSFPIILSSLKERQDESQKTLFKNDSLSSDQAAPIPFLPKKINNGGNLPELDQIKKYLKRGDQINNQTLKKLKQDKQINQLFKRDRSSATIYKSSRNLDFTSVDNEKQKEIKRIYMPQKKLKSKPLFIYPAYRGRRQSQQVQTDILDPPAFTARKNQTLQVAESSKYPSFHHHMSYNTIQAIQEEHSSHRQENYKGIQVDIDEEKLLPNKEKKVMTGRAKAISTKNNYEEYVHNIGRTSFDFYNGLSKANNRYKEYKQQQTVFSKTINVKPLIPVKDSINNFHQNQIQQPSIKPKINNTIITNFPEVKQIPQKQVTKKDASIQQGTSSIIPKNRFDDFKDTYKQKSVISTFVPSIQQIDKLPQQPSSLIPQQSQNLSPQLSSRGRQNISRVTQNIISLIPSSPLQKKRPKNKQLQQKQQQIQIDHIQKSSILIQVPSLHELKVGQNVSQEVHTHHPIRQNFNQNQMNWVKNQYHPKHQIFKGVNLLDFHIKKYKNGVYFGQLNEQGQKDGKGIIFYYSGKIYQGQIIKDFKNGKGLEIYPDGSRYKGQFISGVKQGRGIFEWNNGQVYDGQWQNGRKNGSGMWKGVDGQSYIGQWKNGKVEGFGVYVMKNGSRYQGQFKNSLKHGVGTQRFCNGETYVGNYQKNRPNGEGQYYWANGDYYKGEFSNGLRHGQGYFKESKTQIQYRGQYKNDKKCGYGEINYQNGLSYTGNFQNNYRHGFGQLLQNGKMKYRGYWINDQQVDQMQMQQPPKKSLPKPVKRQLKPQPLIHPIKQQQNQLNQSLPRVIPRQHTKHNSSIVIQNNSNREHKHDHDHQGDQGYKRPCGCNKKH